MVWEIVGSGAGATEIVFKVIVFLFELSVALRGKLDFLISVVLGESEFLSRSFLIFFVSYASLLITFKVF